ncbi:MAG: alkaline phosphatase [Thermoanaerobaculia bacterium]|nr:alkaline phosphatase [Thermoanaerobaculia bacterium]
MIRRLIPLLLILAVAPACRSDEGLLEIPPPRGPEGPQNIILLIGDGMGMTHFTVLDQIRGEESSLPRFTSAAIVTTHSADSLVADSGASATAMATGIKTINGALSMTPSGEPVETVLELAEEKGMATGLVTTSRFWDATPAAFAAHTMDRNGPGVLEQVLASGADLVISNDVQSLGADDRPSVPELARTYGYTPVGTASELVPIEGKILALFPGNENDLDFPDAPLPTLARFAIETLSADPDGFFLMIESEGTDTASHNNETELVLDSLRSLDGAVSAALEFAAANGDTLVLFTGDHETGGFQIASPTRGDDPRELHLEWFSGRHTGQAIPIFAYGPGANRFEGWIDNTDIGKTLKEMVQEKPAPVSSRSE